ncbi:GNAT family N-acetyltransferase [Labilibaculum antarcticum]|uniref:BioF2-like acetyltransferase domain-containing protein n=1 Tax=Labilibaculum antarcticum TaxID=1717717 RepID=A0A1Y1CQG2_9BACT|nr:GNAT family N-acetyltransferase [Labilibaculum antarcticum]BAX82615.1 hypothetical protein ALGA_4325 [Labilibaculum antarcticum]
MIRILEAKKECDYKEWVDIWTYWNGKEVFAHPNYLLLYKEWSEVHCAVYEVDDKKILFPFCLRKIPFDIDRDSYYDMITPYGYSDIYQIGKGDFKQMQKDFHQEFRFWCKAKNVVSEFVRFDLFSKSLGNYSGKLVYINDNIVCDLTLGATEIWKQFKPKVRRNIKKAETYSLQVEMDASGERLSSFLDMYYQTMERRNAQEKYFFSKDFFEAIHKNLKRQFMYFYATHEGVVVSTELVLISDDKIYFFLGGTKEAAFYLRPNDFLKYEIMKWGIKQNKKYYVLGGGYTLNDSLFSFKKAFAPNGCMPFYAGTKIYDEETYQLLVDQARAKRPNSGLEISKDEAYFPLYRKGLDDYLI